MESAVAFVCIVLAIRVVLHPATAPGATRTEILVRIAIAVVLVPALALRRRSLVLKGRVLAVVPALVLRRRNLALALKERTPVPVLALKGRTHAAVLALNRKKLTLNKRNLTLNRTRPQQNGRRAPNQPTNRNRAAPRQRRTNHVTGASIRERAAPTQGLPNNPVSYTRLQQTDALDLEKLIHDGLALFVAHEAGSVTEEGTNNTGSETGEEGLYTALLVNGLSA